MRLPRAGPIRLGAPSPRCGSLLSPERSFASGGTSRTSPHRLALRLALPFGEEGARQSLQRRRLLSCRSRGARARARRAFRLHEDALRSMTGFAPATSRSLGSADRPRSAHSTWQRIAFPRDPSGALSRTTSLVRRSRRARLPLQVRVGAARRRPRSSRPMSAAHGCCFQRRSPHVSAHVASPVPTRCESLRIHAARPASANRRTAPGCCLPQPPHPTAYL
jgi:hypothetical protein